MKVTATYDDFCTQSGSMELTEQDLRKRSPQLKMVQQAGSSRCAVSPLLSLV